LRISIASTRQFEATSSIDGALMPVVSRAETFGSRTYTTARPLVTADRCGAAALEPCEELISLCVETSFVEIEQAFDRIGPQ